MSSPFEPLVQIQNYFTEFFLMMPSTKIAHMFLCSRGGATSLLQEYSYLRKQVRSHDTVSKAAYVSNFT